MTTKIILLILTVCMNQAITAAQAKPESVDIHGKNLHQMICALQAAKKAETLTSDEALVALNTLRTCPKDFFELQDRKFTEEEAEAFHCMLNPLVRHDFISKITDAHLKKSCYASQETYSIPILHS